MQFLVENRSVEIKLLVRESRKFASRCSGFAPREKLSFRVQLVPKSREFISPGVLDWALSFR
jgi:hypothetical protein